MNSKTKQTLMALQILNKFKNNIDSIYFNRINILINFIHDDNDAIVNTISLIRLLKFLSLSNIKSQLPFCITYNDYFQIKKGYHYNTTIIIFKNKYKSILTIKLDPINNNFQYLTTQEKYRKKNEI